jgi:pyruvate,water dikinase
LLTALEQLAHEYSFLSEVGTDISVATWRENPQILHALFAQFVCNPPPAITSPIKADTDIHRWQHRQAQARLNLKGQVATVYLQLLAELRWSIVALEKQAIAQHLICEPGDIFFLTYEELKDWLGDLPTASATTIQSQITARRSRYERHLTYDTIPFIVYGNNPPPAPPPVEIPLPTKAASWQGIGASVGQVQGTVKVLRTLQADVTIPPQTILVVPYTDAGWAPLLARATGIVSEVGGRLSHGAIVAREYSIPAVMNIPHATQLFQDGQTLRLDGRTGVVELVTDGLS